MLIEKDRVGKLIDRTGLDTYELCIDKQHFENYNKKISYKYNSKGFRDVEWPLDFSNWICCIGDSYTEGLGQPFEETWPQMLQKGHFRASNRPLRPQKLLQAFSHNDTPAL